jgi:hypothetical protein
MTKFISLLVTHLVLLALASTRFTIVPGAGAGQFNWEYFRYASQSGWGGTYVSAYSLPVVVTYLAAYATGIAAYAVAYRRGSPLIGIVGILLCAVGCASFGFELTHWLHDHQRSLIASAPIALVALAPIAFIQQRRRRSATLV